MPLTALTLLLLTLESSAKCFVVSSLLSLFLSSLVGRKRQGQSGVALHAFYAFVCALYALARKRIVKAATMRVRPSGNADAPV
jgi:hypothetical protein